LALDGDAVERTRFVTQNSTAKHDSEQHNDHDNGTTKAAAAKQLATSPSSSLLYLLVYTADPIEKLQHRQPIHSAKRTRSKRISTSTMPHVELPQAEFKVGINQSIRSFQQDRLCCCSGSGSQRENDTVTLVRTTFAAWNVLLAQNGRRGCAVLWRMRETVVPPLITARKRQTAKSLYQCRLCHRVYLERTTFVAIEACPPPLTRIHSKPRKSLHYLDETVSVLPPARCGSCE